MVINPALHSSAKHDWCTPPGLYRALESYFGGFTLDAACTRKNCLAAKGWTAKEDGLQQPWDGSVWYNPPYGRAIFSWVDKALTEIHQNPKCSQIVMLLPARTDTEVFHGPLRHAAQIHFLKGRIRFVGARHGAPFPSMICVFWNTVSPGMGTKYLRSFWDKTSSEYAVCI